MTTPTHTNPFLSGNYAPVGSEDDFELEIIGEIPAGLQGVLYRNGPNPQFEPRDPNHHWFAGDGMIHGFWIADGQVRYRNRYIRTPKWNTEHEAGRSVFGSMGNPFTTDPAYIGRETGVANTNILSHAGRLLALEEGHAPFELDPATLDSLGYVDAYRGRVTAHPKIDPGNGEMIWFGYGIGETPFGSGISYGVTDPNGTVLRRDTFEAPFCSMVHDFMVTENYVLFPILPLTGDMKRAMSGRSPWAWEPDKGSHVGVMRRDGSVEDVRWFNTEACYIFHPMNAWEADGKLHADVMRYDAAPYATPEGIQPVVKPPVLVRWTFDLGGASNAIKEVAIDDFPGEFPRLDDRFATRAYRHGWWAGARHGNDALDLSNLVHLDLTTGARQHFELPPGDAISEPVFVPRHQDAPEGDGWIVAVMWRGNENRSELVVFDAQDVAKGPIAIAKVPRRVPFGFHGNWVSHQ